MFKKLLIVIVVLLILGAAVIFGSIGAVLPWSSPGVINLPPGQIHLVQPRLPTPHYVPCRH